MHTVTRTAAARAAARAQATRAAARDARSRRARWVRRFDGRRREARERRRHLLACLFACLLAPHVHTHTHTHTSRHITSGSATPTRERTRQGTHFFLFAYDRRGNALSLNSQFTGGVLKAACVGGPGDFRVRLYPFPRLFFHTILCEGPFVTLCPWWRETFSCRWSPWRRLPSSASSII